MIYLILFYNCLALGVAQLSIVGKKDLRAEKMVQCQGADTSMVLKDILLNYQKSVMKVNGQVIIKEPLTGSIDMIMEITKCKAKGEDTCEFHSRHKLSVKCEQLFEKNKMWTDFIEHMDGFDGCPIKPGTYEVQGAPISLSSVERMPVELGYWKVTTKGLQNKEEIFCVQSEVEILQQRKQKFG